MSSLTRSRFAEVLSSAFEAEKLMQYGYATLIKQVLSEFGEMDMLVRDDVSRLLMQLHEELLKLDVPLKSVMNIRRHVWLNISQ